MEKRDYYLCTENKGADQLCSNCTADLHLYFAYADCRFSDVVAYFGCLKLEGVEPMMIPFFQTN